MKKVILDDAKVNEMKRNARVVEALYNADLSKDLNGLVALLEEVTTDSQISKRQMLERSVHLVQALVNLERFKDERCLEKKKEVLLDFHMFCNRVVEEEQSRGGGMFLGALSLGEIRTKAYKELALTSRFPDIFGSLKEKKKNDFNFGFSMKV